MSVCGTTFGIKERMFSYQINDSEKQLLLPSKIRTCLPGPYPALFVSDMRDVLDPLEIAE